jgi:hypothetical protein
MIFPELIEAGAGHAIDQDASGKIVYFLLILRFFRSVVVPPCKPVLGAHAPP